MPHSRFSCRCKIQSSNFAETYPGVQAVWSKFPLTEVSRTFDHTNIWPPTEIDENVLSSTTAPTTNAFAAANINRIARPLLYATRKPLFGFELFTPAEMNVLGVSKLLPMMVTLVIWSNPLLSGSRSIAATYPIVVEIMFSRTMISSPHTIATLQRRYHRSREHYLDNDRV